MTPYYADDWLTIYQGDVRDVLPSLPSDSVDCIVTSPPYWGLRDYGTASWSGGSEDCDHRSPTMREGRNENRAKLAGSAATNQAQLLLAAASACGKCGAVRQDSQLGLERTPEEYVANMVAVFRELRRVLKPTGTAWLNLGDSYAAGGGSGEQRLAALGERMGTGGGKKHSSRPSGRAPSAGLAQKQLVGIPWRVAFALQADGWVLRSDVVWSKPNPMPESVTDRPTKSHEMLFLLTKAKRIGPEPTKYDDIPEGEARWLAALFDGEGSLVCRREGSREGYGAHAAQVSIGSTSRTLLDRLAAVIGEGNVLERGGTNAPMFYWQTSGKRAMGLLRRLYPFLVVKQRQARCLIALEERKMIRGGHKRLEAKEIAYRDRIWQAVKTLNHFGLPDLTDIPEPVFGRWTSQPYYYDADAVREAGTGRETFFPATPQLKALAESGVRNDGDSSNLTPAVSRNLRSVWTIATRPYPGAHFAVFPPELPERCIKAGSSERGVCPDCGAPWERVVEQRPYPGELANAKKAHGGVGNNLGGQRHQDWLDANPKLTTGWRATCDHKLQIDTDDGWTYEYSSGRHQPAVVLDPFAGSGTTGMVANRLSRRAILVDLNGDYVKQQLKRNAQTPLGLAG